MTIRENTVLAVPDASPGDQRAREAIEQELVRIWLDVLELTEVDVSAGFMALGGDSVSARRMLFQVRESFGVALTPHEFMEADTVSSLAQLIERRPPASSATVYETDHEEGVI
jgi:acyl carrier protein